MCDESFCGKHGHCEENVCVCDRFWSGKTDILNYDGWSCPAFEPLNVSLWSLTLVGMCILQVRIIKAFLNQWGNFSTLKKRAAKRGTKLRWWEFRPLLLVVIAQFSPTILYISVPFKVALTPYRVIGHDPLLTITFYLAASVQFWGNIMAEESSFITLMQGVTSVKPSDAEKLRKSIFRKAYVAVTLYSLGAAPAFFSSLVIGDPVPDPRESVVRHLLILRNLSITCYLIWMAILAKQTTKATKSLLDQRSSANKSDASNARTEILLEHMRQNAKEKIKTSVVACLLYGTFCFPFAWPYQGIPMAFLLFKLGSSRAHYVCNYSKRTKGDKQEQRYLSSSLARKSLSPSSISVHPEQTDISVLALENEDKGSIVTVEEHAKVNNNVEEERNIEVFPVSNANTGEELPVKDSN